jgi:2-hydroxy-6-oxonona-2,4-dienedioate hydrolase
VTTLQHGHLRSGDWRLHARYAVEAGEAALPLVLVHGLVVSSRYMAALARQLASRYRVFAPDLPGFGRSDKPRRVLSLAELADALARWLDAAGLARAAFYANSLGCQILVEFALRHPARVEGLVLQGPTMDQTRPGARWQILHWLANGSRERLSLNAILAADYAQAGVRRALLGFRHALRHPMKERLAQVPHPTLVIRGGRDPIVSQAWAEQVAGLLPRGRLVVIPGGPHTLNHSRPLEVSRVLRPFLDGLLRTGATA